MYDKNIVERIAEDTHINKRLIEALDEKTRGDLQEWIMAVFQNASTGSDAYIKHLSEIILSIAKCGKAIIIGRGANFIIPKGQMLDILLVAPLEHRVYNVAEKLGLTYQDAKKMVHDSDLARHAFLRKFFSHDEFDPLNYDLVINTGNLSFSNAADIIVEALCDKFESSLEELRYHET